MQYRKKPVVIEAVQITDEWFDGDHPNPLHPIGTPDRPLVIRTAEKTPYFNTGDESGY